MNDYSPRGASNSRLEASRGISGQRKRRLRASLGAVVAGFSVLGLWYWVTTDPIATPIAEPSGEPELEVDNLQSFTVREAGQKRWEFSAKRITIASDKPETLASDVSNAILYRDGQPQVRLQAPQVRLNTRNHNVEATKGVKANGTDRFAFTTPVVRWDNDRKQIFCPQPVQARLREFAFSASSLSYDAKNDVLESQMPVEMRGRGALLKSGRFKAQVKGRQIELGGGVELVFDPHRAPLPASILPKAKP